MADHTESAVKLVRELKQNKLLPKFNHELFAEVTTQIKQDHVKLME